jgi:hypothetical protein
MKASGQLPVAVPTNIDQYLEERARKMETELLTVCDLFVRILPDVSLSGGELRIAPLKKAVFDG